MHTLPNGYTCEVSLKSYCQLFRYGEQIVARKRKKKKKKKKKKQFNGRWHFVMQITP